MRSDFRGRHVISMQIADPGLLLRLLLLLGVANGTPVLGKHMLGRRLEAPLDGGRTFGDGRPIFGASKTLRGIALAIVCTSLTAACLGMSWWIGTSLAAASMAGDLFSSFTKRRLGLPLHARAFGLDQIPEALLPLLALRSSLRLGISEIVLVLIAFVVLEVFLSRLLFRLGIRDRPH